MKFTMTARLNFQEMFADICKKIAKENVHVQDLERETITHVAVFYSKVGE